ncbi:MAG: hypothetical protein H6741_03565 [Alphaproteobacteria bacterium]|nr:hypothetical protein [Alphaproteobacteria bacterium]MCB9791783.1 hypothetical protein [Alphaproteobacteria bacterium]
MHVLPLIALMLGCAGDGPTPRVGDGDGFFASPWPSSARSNALGGPDLSGFPKSDELDLLGKYVELGAEAVDGASTVAPIYLAFDGPIDTSLLPDAATSVTEHATVFLVNIDPDSPGWGERVPLRWDFQAEASAYQSDNLLAVAPLVGTPLKPRTLYAAVVTTELAQRHPSMEEVFDPEHPDYASAWEPLRLALFEQGVRVEEVAVATVFRTGDPTADLRAISRQIRDHLGHQVLDQELDWIGANAYMDVYEGKVFLPVWQHGDPPYASEGGGFERGPDGEILMARWERVTFSLAVPKLDDMPPGGWPIALYAHGTGGDHLSCCDPGQTDNGGTMLTREGIAVLGVSQPLHGDRATPGTNAELHTFNFLNPASGRSTFRQGAADSIYLAQVLASGLHTFQVEGGPDVILNPEHFVYMGHSQGGITGALALPFVGDVIDGAVLSGAGGGLSLTLVYREQGGLDIEALMRELLEFDDDEDLDPLHPTVALIQTLTDVTDPLNYSRGWFKERGPLGLPPISVLMTEGLEDQHTPPLTTEALAASAGLPVLEPAAVISEDFIAQGLSQAVPLPASDNLVGWDGTPVTGGLQQYPGWDHFVVFDNRDAAEQYRRFLHSVVTDTPIIVP